MGGVYVPRSPTTGALYGVVRGHWSDFAADVRDRTDGVGLPAFVVSEFRKFLRCGVLAHGFARVRCADCAFERLVPFSCKGRGFCPSCGGRRMAERAAHLVEHVFAPDVPVRQWVLSVPHRLRYRLAYDHRLCRTVLAVFVRALRSAYRRHAKRAGLGGGETGMVTSVQRFRGALNLHVHFHTLVLDGVFVRQPGDTLVFHSAAPPTHADVHRVVRRVHRRLARLGLVAVPAEDVAADSLAEESAALAGLTQAAVLGRSVLGGRTVRGPLRIGADPDVPWVERAVPLHAHEAGFDLHAAGAGSRRRRRPAHAALPLCLPAALRAAAPAAASLGRCDDAPRVHSDGAARAARAAGVAAARESNTPFSRLRQRRYLWISSNTSSGAAGSSPRRMCSRSAETSARAGGLRGQS